MMNAIEKELIDAFIALLCTQKNKQKKVTQEIMLRDLFRQATTITAFSPEAGDYFIWQLCLQGSEFDIVGCGATEFSWLVERWKQPQAAISAFKALLHEKEKMLQQQKKTFLMTFLAWFDNPTDRDRRVEMHAALWAVVPTTMQTDRSIHLDNFLSLRLRSWINRLFLMLEEKYPEHQDLGLYMEFLYDRPHEIVVLAEEKVFTLLHEQTLTIADVRKKVQQEFLFWVCDKSVDKALKEALFQLRANIVLEGHDGLDDISHFLSVLLEPVAEAITKNRTPEEANNIILACERLILQWTDQLNVINTGEHDKLAVVIQFSLASLHMLHDLLKQKTPLNSVAIDLRDQLNNISHHIKNVANIPASLQQIHVNLLGICGKIKQTFLEARYMFNVHEGFHKIAEEKKYLKYIKALLQALPPQEEAEAKKLIEHYEATRKALKSILNVIKQLLLVNMGEEHLLPDCQRESIQHIQRFMICFSVKKNTPEENIIFDALATLGTDIFNMATLSDIIFVRYGIEHFWENILYDPDHVANLELSIADVTNAPLRNEVNKLLHAILHILPPSYSVSQYLKYEAKITRAERKGEFSERNSEDDNALDCSVDSMDDIDGIMELAVKTGNLSITRDNMSDVDDTEQSSFLGSTYDIGELIKAMWCNKPPIVIRKKTEEINERERAIELGLMSRT